MALRLAPRIPMTSIARQGPVMATRISVVMMPRRKALPQPALAGKNIRRVTSRSRPARTSRRSVKNRYGQDWRVLIAMRSKEKTDDDIRKCDDHRYLLDAEAGRSGDRAAGAGTPDRPKRHLRDTRGDENSSGSEVDGADEESGYPGIESEGDPALAGGLSVSTDLADEEDLASVRAVLEDHGGEDIAAE
jgi:hypothetical protein